MARRIKLREERKHGVTIIRPAGRLDSGQIERLEEVIKERIQQNRTRIVIDFTDLHFIASSALRILLTTRQTVEQKDGCIFLCNIQPHILELLRVAGFNRLLEIRADLKQALRDAIPEDRRAEAAAAERRRAATAAEVDAGRAPAVGKPLDREDDEPRTTRRPRHRRRAATATSSRRSENILLTILLVPLRLLLAIGRLLARPFRRKTRPAVPAPQPDPEADEESAPPANEQSRGPKGDPTEDEHPHDAPAPPKRRTRSRNRTPRRDSERAATDTGSQALAK